MACLFIAIKPQNGLNQVVIRLLVPSKKAQKIDLNAEYPCPLCLRRRGRLTLISLTEAFGCDRCQQIFIVEDSGYAIEQLSTSYPYKKAWCWKGDKWMVAHSTIRENYLPLSLGIVVFALCIAAVLAPQLTKDPKIIIFFALVVLGATLMPALWQWIAYRR